MVQSAEVIIPIERYTRPDFAALKAKLSKIPIGVIWKTYYSEESLAELGCTTYELLEARLNRLLDNLIERTKARSPSISSILHDAKTKEKWSNSLVDLLIKAAEADLINAYPGDSCALWFKPKVAQSLRDENIHTLEELKRYIEVRGVGWYRPVPRIGALKAKAIQNWFLTQPALGFMQIRPDDIVGDLIEVSSIGAMAPLERIKRVPHELSGSQGVNRSTKFCLITAKDDLQALQAYLYKFRGQEKTLKSYKKELERFLLWCVIERKIPLSSVLLEDCEAYKDFLRDIPPEWIGSWAKRHSNRWRPFVGQLAPSSQKYAIQVVKACFEWLVKTRYLGANPWVAVSDPIVFQKENSLDIEKAIPVETWKSISSPGGALDILCAQGEPLMGLIVGSKDQRGLAAQYRLARAAIFLMGFSGLRREEVCRARREHLKPILGQDLWELKTLGKRNKWRTVFLPGATIEALRAHWRDRGHDFDDSASHLSLVSPVVLSKAPRAQKKHLTVTAAGASLAGAAFTPDGLYQVVKKAFNGIAQSTDTGLDAAQRELLLQTSPHSLRHTFGTLAAAKEMPLDVLQKLMGHASLQTTTIYVQAERQRSIEESRKFFSG